MNLELVKLTRENRQLLLDMLAEWKALAPQEHTPWAIFRNDPSDFDRYLAELEVPEDNDRGLVPDTALFCLDKDQNIFLGAVNIRHRLNQRLLTDGGHIGDGIRPTQRRKGYATAMIALALDECRKLGLRRVLMCCNADNIGSARSIQKNGGMLENEIISKDGDVVQRYWIAL